MYCYNEEHYTSCGWEVVLLKNSQLSTPKALRTVQINYNDTLIINKVTFSLEKLLFLNYVLRERNGKTFVLKNYH